MCRLFGFRSVIQSQVHKSLVSADNALMQQSNFHPDGWGVAYYNSTYPHIIKSSSAAIEDNLFKHVSGIVSSETVLAHIRRATQGKISLVNTHPFQFAQWVFAHNGNLPNFEEHREEILARVSPKFKRFILGNTDSEVFFFLLLTNMSSYLNIDSHNVDFNLMVNAIRKTIDELLEIFGDLGTKENETDNDNPYLTFLLTNGKMMLAHHGGKSLHYSTYKNRCDDRDVCPSYANECEAPTKNGFVNHLIFSSEPLQGDNIWIPTKPMQIIGVDERMKLFT